MFIINFVILLGLTAFYFIKRQKKSTLCNLAVLFMLILAKFVDVYYINIRTHLYEMLGATAFNALKQFLSVVLFFGSSITVGVQFISEIVGIIVLFFVASKALKILKYCAKRFFTPSISSENEKVVNKFDVFYLRHYLILERLLN